MNARERRATAGLAGIFAVRMLGLALILPVFAIYAEQLAGHTPFLVGMALGIYGLTQALLQIPFGVASDRFGRKPVIITGLLIFTLGSIVAAMATTIEGVIVGRALQGAGAVAAAVIALLADLTRDEQRTKAMALVGMSIGGSFILALVAGPMLYDVVSVPGIFWLTAILALVGIVILVLFIPTPVRVVSQTPSLSLLKDALRDRRMARLNFGIFVLHAAMTAIFVVVPLMLLYQAGIAGDKHWQVYLPVLLASLVIMVPILVIAERRQKLHHIFPFAILLLVLSQGVIYWGQNSAWGIALGLWLFFGAFNALEALMPSLVSRMVPPDSKGAAVGVFSSSQFLGTFVGGAVGGAVLGAFGGSAVFLLSSILLLLWFVVALGMGDIQFKRSDPEQNESKSCS
ncbi:MAG: MFS transporter [Acidiferrobacterales bacterium]